MIRAAVYLRQSVDPTGKGVAVARQRKLCDQLARSRGWTVVEHYVDNDRSASSGQRPAYRQLLTDARAGRFDRVVVYHLDRLTRRVADLETVIGLGLPVATVTGDLDLSTDQGRLLGRILASVGQGEVERKAARQVAANAQRVAAGLPLAGRRPFGFEADRTTQRPDEAAAVKWACHQLLDGGTLRGIAREWNARGHRTANGDPWAPDAVRRVLTRPRVAGLSALHDAEVGPATWAPVVDEETWRGVLAVLRAPSRRSEIGTARRYLLAGVAVCGLCGAALITGWAVGANGVKRRTLRCSAAAHLVRKAAPIEDFVERVILGRLSRPDALDLLAKPGQDAGALRREAAALRARRDDLASLVADGVLDAAAVKDRAAPLLERLRAIGEALAPATPHPAQRLADAADVAKAWATLDINARSAVVEALVAVTVHSAGRGAQLFDPATVDITWKQSEPSGHARDSPATAEY